MILNNLEEEIITMTGSAMFGLPGKESDRNGPTAKPRTLGIGWLLYAFVRAARPCTIVEIGNGGSTCCLLWGIKHNGVGHLHNVDVFATCGTDDVHHSIDYLRDEAGNPLNHCHANFLRQISKWGFEDVVTLHHMSSMDFVSSWSRPIDMLVVDGDHRQEYVQNDCRLIKFLTPGGYAMFHDVLACPYDIGKTVLDFIGDSDNYSFIIEPNCLSMAIIQKKFTMNAKAMLTANKLASTINPNNADTPINMTAPRECGILRDYSGYYFEPTPKQYHSFQAEGEKRADEIMEQEKTTGIIVESL